MRLVLSAVLAGSLLSAIATAHAAEATPSPSDDEILSDLVVISAAPRPVDVKMVVQAAKPADKKAEAKNETAAQDMPAPQPIKTAAK
jgi:hypothetical protein